MDNDTSLINVLVAPKRFFGALGAGKEKIGLPALIVLVSALIAGVAGYLVAASLSIDVPDVNSATLSLIIGISAAFIVIVTMFVVWVIMALVLHVIAKILGGTGSFKSTLAAAGYGTFPQIISGLVTVAVLLVYHPDMGTLASTGLKALGTVNPFLAVTAVVGIIVLIWSVVIETYGLAYAHDLSIKKALVAPALLAIISLILNLF